MSPVNTDTPAEPQHPRLAHRFFPGGQPSVMLTGFILPPDKEDPGLFVQVSPDRQACHEEEAREVMEALARLRPWDEAEAAVAELGADENLLEASSEDELLLRLPGSVTEAEVERIFSGYRFLVLEHRVISNLNGLTADLKLGGETVKISAVLAEMVIIFGRTPPGDGIPRDISWVLRRTLDSWPGRRYEIMDEFVTMFPRLINGGIVALIRVA